MSTIYSRAEVAKHNKHADCWVTYRGNVYNLTDFVDDHPGGDDLLVEYAGQDVTDIMADPLSHEHSASAYVMLDEFRVGKVPASEAKAPVIVIPGFAGLAPVVITDDFEPEETDMLKDFTENKFLDLELPLIPQMWHSNFTKEFYLEQVHIPRHKKDSARLMPYHFLEVFTLTPWYVVPMLWAPIALGFFYTSVTQFAEQVGGPSAYAWAAVFATSAWVFGIVFWTFIEYLFHRYLFHMDEMLPRHQFAYLMHFLLHGIHHFLPMDRMRLVMPPVMFAVLSFPMLLLAHAVLPTAVANGTIAGSYTMYIFYDTFHYAMHHTKLPKYLTIQKKYHLEHHYKNYDLGYGVTSKFWDIIFRTLL